MLKKINIWIIALILWSVLTVWSLTVDNFLIFNFNHLGYHGCRTIALFIFVSISNFLWNRTKGDLKDSWLNIVIQF